GSVLLDPVDGAQHPRESSSVSFPRPGLPRRCRIGSFTRTSTSVHGSEAAFLLTFTSGLVAPTNAGAARSTVSPSTSAGAIVFSPTLHLLERSYKSLLFRGERTFLFPHHGEPRGKPGVPGVEKPSPLLRHHEDHTISFPPPL